MASSARVVGAGSSCYDSKMADSTVQWREDGTPVSPRFGDIYRSSSGLRQAREVFVRGCGLLPSDPAEIAKHARPRYLQGAVATPVWAKASSWSVLEAGFGLGLNFLATWQAWQDDPDRPQRLFYSAIEAFPPDAADLLRSAAPYPELQPLADALAAQWHGLLPGLHRISLEGGRVQLTLAVGDVRAMLAELSGTFDSLYLDGFDPLLNPDMWTLPVLKAMTRLARPGARVATWTVAAPVRHGLRTCGFTLQRVRGPWPKRSVLRGTLAPSWSPRHRPDPQAPVQVRAPGHCAVVGGGLAGASVAYSLAQRGWQVTVWDAADAPATGASGLPAGVVAPHVSPDDRPVSRLTRAGARATLARAAALLRPGADYGATGVLERHAAGERRLPAAWQATLDGDLSAATAPVSWPDSVATTRQRAQSASVPLNDADHALWHSRAGWVRPAELVRAMLNAPGITWRGGHTVTGVRPVGPRWQLLGATDEALLTRIAGEAGDAGPTALAREAPTADAAAANMPTTDVPAATLLAEADLVFVTAGFGSLALLPHDGGAALPLHALRGQVAWGPMPSPADPADALPAFPVNGHGSLIAHVPGDSGAMWVAGSTFERGEAQPVIRPQDHAHNRDRLAELLPEAGRLLAPQWQDGRAQAWAAVRATLPDRLPAVGAWAAAAVDAAVSESNEPLAPYPPAQAAIENEAIPAPLPLPLPLHLITGLGARGLTLAVLCGDIAAAWLHGEPLPVEATLARKLRAGRFRDAAKPGGLGDREDAG